MNHSVMPGMDHGSMGNMPMGHSMPGMTDMPTGAAGANVEEGVEVDNVAMMPSERLNSAGEGFPEGLRVLSYADLKATRPGLDPRPPSREITLHLTGNMQRFIWGFDGRTFSEAGPIELARDERVRITLINDTMMEHPIICMACGANSITAAVSTVPTSTRSTSNQLKRSAIS